MRWDNCMNAVHYYRFWAHFFFVALEFRWISLIFAKYWVPLHVRGGLKKQNEERRWRKKRIHKLFEMCMICWYKWMVRMAKTIRKSICVADATSIYRSYFYQLLFYWFSIVFSFYAIIYSFSVRIELKKSSSTTSSSSSNKKKLDWWRSFEEIKEKWKIQRNKNAHNNCWRKRTYKWNVCVYVCIAQNYSTKKKYNIYI